jgi:hypothetical protein
VLLTIYLITNNLLTDCHFGQLSFGQLSYGQLSFGQLSFGQLSFGQLSFGQLSFGQLSFGQLSFGQLSFDHLPTHLFQPKDNVCSLCFGGKLSTFRNAQHTSLLHRSANYDPKSFITLGIDPKEENGKEAKDVRCQSYKNFVSRCQ